MKINVFSRVVILKKIVEENVCIEKKIFLSFTVYMTDENYIGFYVIYIIT